MDSKTSSSPHESDGDVANRVREALEQTDCKELDPTAIKVTVDDGKVVLTGNAPTYEALNAAGDAASRAQGVIEVQNDILIEPL